MKKLTLESLSVESFDTTPDGAVHHGTVHAAQCTCPTACSCPGCPTCDASWCNTACETCPATCADDTCQGATCEAPFNTCWNSCNTAC